MKKMSRSALEDMKGFVRVAETLLEIAVLSLLYYYIWSTYELPVLYALNERNVRFRSTLLRLKLLARQL